ncbi:hypothetical protein SEMRO_1942_G306760.1 [Seminavis robusta]|uniref:Uncharacterized protein n=1 Tax=Seminavis robusta TaxID=568900 RepID=A0A9N8ETX6_9STRA|nr:hypothetical protein SEMRO_1942_G306760.1 [Seminavis robusta]|eukprot:Sro1942_g306760.1 n/a (112) ;mRNA; f:10019-10354
MRLFDPQKRRGMRNERLSAAADTKREAKKKAYLNAIREQGINTSITPTKTDSNFAVTNASIETVNSRDHDFNDSTAKKGKDSEDDEAIKLVEWLENELKNDVKEIETELEF